MTCPIIDNGVVALLVIILIGLLLIYVVVSEFNTPGGSDE